MDFENDMDCDASISDFIMPMMSNTFEIPIDCDKCHFTEYNMDECFCETLIALGNCPNCLNYGVYCICSKSTNKCCAS
jgi:hypothetical protein